MLHSTDYWENILLMLVEAVTASSTHHQSFLQLHRIQSEGSTLLTIHESSSAQLILLLHIRKLILLLQIRHNFQVTRQCGVQSIRYISATSASQFLHVIVLQPSMYWSCTWYKVHSKVSCAQYQGFARSGPRCAPSHWSSWHTQSVLNTPALCTVLCELHTYR